MDGRSTASPTETVATLGPPSRSRADGAPPRVARRPRRGAPLLSSCALYLLFSLLVLGGAALGGAPAAGEGGDPPGAPRITAGAVTSDPPTGEYREGDAVEFDAAASAKGPGAEPPALAVAVDQAVPSGVVHAPYLSGSGTDSPAFALRVAADHRDDDGVSAPASAGGVRLDGGLVHGPDGTPLSAALAPGVELPDQPGHRVRAGAGRVDGAPIGEGGGGHGRLRDGTDESLASLPAALSALQGSGGGGAGAAFTLARGRAPGTAAGVPGGTGPGDALERRGRGLLQVPGEGPCGARLTPRGRGSAAPSVCRGTLTTSTRASPTPARRNPVGPGGRGYRRGGRF